MYTKSHLLISAVVGAAIVVWTGVPPNDAVLLVGYAAFVGAAIDLDHFVVARLRADDWRHLRSAVSNPRVAFVAQDELFEEGDVGPMTRLLSHALLGGALVVGLVAVDRFLALLTLVVLYVHVVCDLLAGVRVYEPPGWQP